MHMTRNPRCRIDVRFNTSVEGRPELFDFFWEHVSVLYQQNPSKKIQIDLQPGWTNALNPIEWEHVLQKLSADRKHRNTLLSRPHIKGEGLTFLTESKKLDQLVNNYNVFFDAVLPYVTIHSPELSMDFSHAHEHRVTMKTTSVHAEKIRSYLNENLTQPRIRTIRYGITHPLQRLINAGVKNTGKQGFRSLIPK